VANNPAKRLPGRLKQLRLSLALTQEKFAERAGIDYKYYQHIEAGRKQNLTMDILNKLAAVCELELWELLRFDAVAAVGENLAERKVPKPAGHRKGPRKA